MKVGQSNTYADQACRPMTTTRTRTGKNCRPAADPPTPKIAAKRKDIADTICLRKRNVPKICASTTGYLVFLRRSADCFTDKNGSRKNPARQHVCVVCAGLPDQSTRTRWTLPCQTPNSEHIYREASQQRACSAVPQRPHRLHSFLPSEGSSGPDFSAESFSLHFAQTAAKEETHQGGGDAREGGGGGADAHGCC